MTAIVTFSPGSFGSPGEIIIGDYPEGGQRGGMTTAAHSYTGRKKDSFDLSVGSYFTTFKWEGFRFVVRDPDELSRINDKARAEEAEKASVSSVRDTDKTMVLMAKEALGKIGATTWRQIVKEQVARAYQKGWEAKTEQVNSLDSLRASTAIPKKYQIAG